jgi:RNA polymerase sigma factor (sigma-70 family)
MGDRDRRWAAVYAHRERLLKLARSRLDNPHDAEDCVQEAMLRCVEFADLDEERLGQFLTSVTMRLCADVHRGRLRGDKLNRRMTSFFQHDPGPEDSICDRAESQWLSGRLAELSPKQRAIVEARAEGLSCSAVAERVKVPYTTVESALARVRRSLRLALESTLGVVALRSKRVTAGTLLAGTAALSVAGMVDLPERRAPVLPPRAEAAVREVGLDPLPAGPARTIAARPAAAPLVRVVAASRGTSGPLIALRDPSEPTSKPSPARVAGQSAPLHEARKYHQYSDAERTVHCARYGVAVGDGIECRFPPGDPRNIDERLGTPPAPLPEGGQ